MKIISITLVTVSTGGRVTCEQRQFAGEHIDKAAMLARLQAETGWKNAHVVTVSPWMGGDKVKNMLSDRDVVMVVEQQ